DGFKSRPYHMFSFRSAGEAEKCSPCITIPVWSAETNKCWYHIDAICSINICDIFFTLRCVMKHFDAITEPLDSRTSYKNTSFQRILYFSVQTPSQCR